MVYFFFFFKQKTAYEMRISDWSSDVCSSDLEAGEEVGRKGTQGSLGHPRRSHSRAPGYAEPRPDASPPRHPGVRARADRGQGDPASPAGLLGIQRRFRRRSEDLKSVVSGKSVSVRVDLGGSRIVQKKR